MIHLENAVHLSQRRLERVDSAAKSSRQMTRIKQLAYKNNRLIISITINCILLIKPDFLFPWQHSSYCKYQYFAV